MENLTQILNEAKQAAENATVDFFYNQLKGEDKYACGFAWVEIRGIKGNSKLGRALKKAGVTQNYRRAFELLNPGNYRGQNIAAKEVGAVACANVLRSYGFNAIAGSRLD